MKKLRKEQFLSLTDQPNTKYANELYKIIEQYIKKSYKLDDFLISHIADTSLKELIHLMRINKVEIISNYKNIESLMKSFVSNNEFLFDVVALEEVKYMELKDLKDVIEKYTKDHIYITDNIPSLSIDTMSYPEEKIISKEESLFFHEKKLILNKERYKGFIEILAFDISNPFKRKVILSNLFFKTNINKLIFHQFTNEKIFINYL